MCSAHNPFSTSINKNMWMYPVTLKKTSMAKQHREYKLQTCPHHKIVYMYPIYLTLCCCRGIKDVFFCWHCISSAMEAISALTISVWITFPPFKCAMQAYWTVFLSRAGLDTGKTWPHLEGTLNRCFHARIQAFSCLKGHSLEWEEDERQARRFWNRIMEVMCCGCWLKWMMQLFSISMTLWSTENNLDSFFLILS